MIRSFDYYDHYKNQKIRELQLADLQFIEQDVDLSKLISSKLKDFFNIQHVSTDKKVIKMGYDYFLMLSKV